MRTTMLSIVGHVALTVAVHAQTPVRPAAHEPLPEPLAWRLLPSEQPCAAIDGRHLKDLVDDQTAMSRRYRDNGHQFWGRISGTEADAENARWLLEKFRQSGLSDVREQAFDIPLQWMSQSWSMSASDGAGRASTAPAAASLLRKEMAK